MTKPQAGATSFRQHSPSTSVVSAVPLLLPSTNKLISSYFHPLVSGQRTDTGETYKQRQAPKQGGKPGAA